MKGQYIRNNPADTKEKLHKLKALQSLSLNDKIEIANKVIVEALKIGNPCLLYSGGKDSTVLLDLVLKHKKDILVMYNDTTLGAESTLQFIREYTKGLNYIETTADNPIVMWQSKGYYPILSKRGFTAYKKKYKNLKSSPVQCCYQLKEKYCNRVLKEKDVKVVFWGNRAGESNRRKFSFVDNGFLFKPKKYKWHQAYPLQHFKDNDIVEYLETYVKQYPIEKTFESGCVCCGTDITFKNNNLQTLFVKDITKWEYYMRNGFAEQILIAKGINNIDETLIEKVINQKPKFLLQI